MTTRGDHEPTGGVPSEQSVRLSLWDVASGLSWYPLLLMGLGGLSIIDILERAVFEGLEWVTPLRVVMDGYDRLTLLAAVLLEPILAPVVRYLGARLELNLHLHEHWRPLFVFSLTYAVGVLRFSANLTWFPSILARAALSIVALAGATLAGLFPLTSSWWMQGSMAATPIVFVIGAMMWWPLVLADLDPTGEPLQWEQVAAAHAVPAVVGVVAFVLGAALSLVPGLASGAGFAALGLVVALLGYFQFQGALMAGAREGALSGLTIVGGFLAAGLVLIANWLSQTLG